jgi:hypothetical protein
MLVCCRLRLKCDSTRAGTRFRLSAKRTSPFKSAGASVQSTAGSRGVRISGSNAGCTRYRGSLRVQVTHFIRQFPLHFPSRASPCTITFQLDSPRTVTWCMVFILKKRHAFKKVLPHWYQTKPSYQMTTLAQNVKFATHIFGFFRRVFKFAKKKDGCELRLLFVCIRME